MNSSVGTLGAIGSRYFSGIATFANGSDGFQV
jgi:hypothetical protein